MLRNLKQFNLPEIEEKVLKFWKENQIFEKSVALRQAQGKSLLSFDNAQDKQASVPTKVSADRQGKKPFRFFEGPPTANGRPGIHHMLSRAFKDVICRYKTMRGFLVRRKAGWDTHGLPVEIEVEKELGLKSKQDIEKFGIAEFNEKAKASVWKYQDEWERLTDRIGFWLDLKNPYITYKPDYIESLWWVFEQIAKRGLLKQSFKVVPYCPRCQTSLSSHELNQPGAYQRVKDPSVWIKFELSPTSVKASGVKPKGKEYLLVWTTTPWTLPSNVAIAVNPALTYTKYSVRGGSASGGKVEYIWSYGPPPVEADMKIEVTEKVSGKKMIGLRYKPLFSINGPWLKNPKFFRVYGADFVETTEGTGLVHIAPAFGEDDMNLMKKYEEDLVGKIPITIDEKGLVQKGIPGAGKPAKKADKDILEDLKKRKILFKEDVIEHDYPFCWRCNTALLYFSQFSWFIEMSKLREDLLKNNQNINWVPEHIKEGRFGDWLREIKDWAISRNRYWGTPMPIWQCGHMNSEVLCQDRSHEACNANLNKAKRGCGHKEVIGSLYDLDRLGFSQNNFYILRHGEADHTLKNLIASGPERGKRISKLTLRGIKQIENVAKNLTHQLKGKKLDFILASPYFRTKQTAKIIAKAIGGRIIFDKRLVELNCGVFNWRLIKEHREFFANPVEKFTKPPSGGENLNEVKQRMFLAISDIENNYSGKTILVGSHGDPLWVLEGILNGLSNKEILELDYIREGELRKIKLHNWPRNSGGELDIHRPYVDDIYLRCPKCENKMYRIKEVIDVWFDSGAMPFAQFHYPFNCAQAKSEKRKAKSLGKCIDFPADYISEGIDQTRGWFYTLLAVATALGLKAPYRNVITIGMVLDKHGQKMSKSKGNIVSPWDMVNKYGADVVRWYFYTVNPPGEPKHFDEADLGKYFRKVIAIVYNSFVFFNTYGDKVKSDPAFAQGFGGQGKRKAKSENILDMWIVSRLNETINKASGFFEKYSVENAARTIEVFIDDLSRWYIRRSRTRFQKPTSNDDLTAASRTLHCVLLELSKLISPFMPFFAEALYKSLVTDHESSVHLEDWPVANKEDINHSLIEKMEEARRLSSLALALRSENGIKVRQPLQKLEIKSKILDIRDEALFDILKDEVNVKEIKVNLELSKEIKLDTDISPELKEEGILREFIRMVQGLRHDANYVPKDRIALMVEASLDLQRVLNKNISFLKKEVGAKIIELRKSVKFDAELSSKIDGKDIWIGVRKI